MNEVPKRGSVASSIAMADEAAVGEPPYWNNMSGGMEAYHAFLKETLEAELAGSDRECAGPRASFWKGVGSFFFKRKKKSRRRLRVVAKFSAPFAVRDVKTSSARNDITWERERCGGGRPAWSCPARARANLHASRVLGVFRGSRV